MPRYISRAFIADDIWFDGPSQQTPIVDDHRPVKTGLVDKDGNDIWRAPNPIGFGRDREW